MDVSDSKSSANLTSLQRVFLNKHKIDRSVFKSDQYVRLLEPEQSGGPFTELYHEKLHDVISMVKGDGLHILDVGGGSGRVAIPLAAENEVRLCDLSLDTLERARNKTDGRPATNLALIVADAQSLPFCKEKFDFVLAIDLLVYLENPQRALAEFNRVLRPGGKLIIDSTSCNPLWTVFYPDYVGLNPIRWTKTMLHGGVLPEFQSVVRHYSKSEFIKMLLMAGFIVLEERSYGPSFCPKWNLALAAKSSR